MALTVRPKFDSCRQWAYASLDKAPGVKMRSHDPIYRVFAPYDSGDCAEVLYLDELERPRTAWLNADGSVKKTAPGW